MNMCMEATSEQAPGHGLVIPSGPQMSISLFCLYQVNCDHLRIRIFQRWFVFSQPTQIACCIAYFGSEQFWEGVTFGF